MNRAVMFKADKARNLRYGTNELCLFEELARKPITTIDPEQMSMNEIRALMFCGIRWEDKNMSLEKAGDIMDEVIDGEGLDYLVEKLTKAVSLAVGGPDGKKLETA